MEIHPTQARGVFSGRKESIEKEFNCSVSVQVRERTPLGDAVRKAMCKALKIVYISRLPKMDEPYGWKTAKTERRLS